MKDIIILGSTGSIGTQALSIADENPDKFNILGLSCRRSIDLFEEQIKKFNPVFACVEREEDATSLSKKFTKTEFLWGKEGLNNLASVKCHMVLNGLMGISGLAPTYNGIISGNDIGLANKETMVTGGRLITKVAEEKGVKILPVDSEHSAIFQCLMGNENNQVKRLIITASGGPFRGYNLDELSNVTLAQALKHPNWSMGKKITIDSATMMNKGLEVIEARWLFDITEDKIEVLVHPESIVHSMVEFEDTSIMAQMGYPDMRIPIGLAMNWPKRLKHSNEGLDFIKDAPLLNFSKPDSKVFRCLGLAYDALKVGGNASVILNGANEILVNEFLNERIGFIDIQNTLTDVMNLKIDGKTDDIESILALDEEVRTKTLELINRGAK